jgi:hypothetical protein
VHLTQRARALLDAFRRTMHAAAAGVMGKELEAKLGELARDRVSALREGQIEPGRAHGSPQAWTGPALVTNTLG